MTVESLPPASTLPGDDHPQGRPANRLEGLAQRAAASIPKGRWAIVVFLIALMGLSALLRTRTFTYFYWIDEAISVGIASHPVHDLPHLLREDGSPPLYYLLLHFWMKVFGNGESATHALSLIPALLCIPVAWWGAVRLFGRRAAVFAAVIAAGAPFINSYAQETRMYSLQTLWSLLVAIAFAQVFVRGNRRYLPLFVAALDLALYTHNWALFLSIGCVIGFAICVWREPERRRRLLIDGVIALVAVAVIYAPWVPTLLYQAQHTGAPWAPRPNLWSLTTAGYYLVGGRGGGVAFLLAGGLGLYTLWVARDADRRTTTTVLALLGVGLGTLLIAWLYAKTTPAWAPRYLAVIVGPLLLSFALGFSRAGRLGVAALVLVCCFWALDPPQKARVAKSNVALAVADAKPHVGSNPLIMSTQPEQVPDIAHYLNAPAQYATPLGYVADPGVVDWRNALDKLDRSSLRNTLIPMLAHLKPGQRFVFVTPSHYYTTPKYMALIRKRTIDWFDYLHQNRHLREILSTSANGARSSLPVRFTVYEQVR